MAEKWQEKIEEKFGQRESIFGAASEGAALKAGLGRYMQGITQYPAVPVGTGPGEDSLAGVARAVAAGTSVPVSGSQPRRLRPGQPGFRLDPAAFPRRAAARAG